MQNIAELHEKVYAYLIKEYPDLRFTLRQKDRGGRFDKGYWFSGNDDYLAFSFWQGLDWRNKTPYIYFFITADGEATLNFVSYANENLTKFFTAVAAALGMTQRVRKKTEEPFAHWVKNYTGKSYSEAIEQFFDKEKKVIDSLIGISGLAEVLKDIDKKVFDTNKKRVEKIRTSQHNTKQYEDDWERTRSIYLDKLTIKNIGLYENSEISLHGKGVTCFIGKNGTGKTTLLRSIVLAFTGFENETLGNDNNFDTGGLQNLLQIRGVKGTLPIYAGSGFIKLQYETEFIDDNKVTEKNTVILKKEPTEVMITDDSESAFSNIIDDRYKVLFLAFPQVQGDAVSKTTTENRGKPNVSDAISMLNNSADNRFFKFTNWLSQTKTIANDKINKGEKNPLENQQIKHIFDIISAVSGEDVILHDIVFTIEKEPVIWVKIGKNSNPILLDLISQGFNNIFGWVGYMMQRLSEVTSDKNKENFMQTPAIVLIDEIDTYLHISVQQKILAVLVEKFPNIQFIVTTHSPYTIGSIPNDKIKIYVCKKEGESVDVEEFGKDDDDFDAYGANVERLTKLIFKTPPRIQIIEEKIQQIRSAIQINDFDTAENIFRDLKGLSDPEIRSLQTLLNTKKRLSTAK